MLNLSEILGIILALEMPFSLLGGFVVARIFMKRKDVQGFIQDVKDLLKLLHQGIPVLTALLEEYKKNGHATENQKNENGS